MRPFAPFLPASRTPEPVWPLGKWYAEVRDTRIPDLSVADLARSCRQDLYLEIIVPLCLMTLEEDPLAGELYDGELAAALWKMPDDYWRSHPDEEDRFLKLTAGDEGDQPCKVGSHSE